MTPERVAEIKARCAAATPGPWEATDNHFVVPGVGAVSFDTDNPFTGDSSNDTAFVAAVRTDLPDLLEAYAALLAEYRAYEEAARHELTCGDDGFSHYCGNCGRTIDRNDNLRSIPATPVKETTA